MGWPDAVWLCDALELPLGLAVDDWLLVELVESVAELLAETEADLDWEEDAR